MSLFVFCNALIFASAISIGLGIFLCRKTEPMWVMQIQNIGALQSN